MLSIITDQVLRCELGAKKQEGIVWSNTQPGAQSSTPAVLPHPQEVQTALWQFELGNGMLQSSEGEQLCHGTEERPKPGGP